jgi:hypothetical protein
MQQAIDQLAAVYLSSTATPELIEAINRGASELDRQLVSTPLNVGESREANVRVAFVGPLIADFEVFEDDVVVAVSRIRLNWK